MWRFNPATGDGYYLGINGGGSGSIEVFIYGFIDGGDDGEFYPNSGTYTLPVTNANDFVLRIEMVGSAITVKIDGVSVHSETATLITAAGRVGRAHLPLERTAATAPVTPRSASSPLASLPPAAAAVAAFGLTSTLPGRPCPAGCSP